MAEDVDRTYFENSDTSAEAMEGVDMPRVPVDGDMVIAIKDARFSWPKAIEKPKEDEKNVRAAPPGRASERD
eukprot:2561785-Rhodomonas_salina.2